MSSVLMDDLMHWLFSTVRLDDGKQGCSSSSSYPWPLLKC